MNYGELKQKLYEMMQMINNYRGDTEAWPDNQHIGTFPELDKVIARQLRSLGEKIYVLSFRAVYYGEGQS